MRRDEGQSLVEFALVVPILLLLVIGILQFASAWDHKLSLNAAVRAAARTASTCRFATSSGASTAAINSAYDAIADPALPSHTQIAPSGVTYASGNCIAGTQVTVAGTYPVNVTIMGVTFLNTNLTSTSVSTVE